MKARDIRRIVAYEEAGHAVVARKLGITVAEIDMVPNEDYAANVLTRSAAREAEQAGGDQAAGLYSGLMVALAGSAARQLAAATWRRKFYGNAHTSAAQLARLEAGLPAIPGPDEPHELKPGDPLHDAARDIFERAWAETVALLHDDWLAVERVTDVLAKRDRLAQAELDDIIANGQRVEKGKTRSSSR
jgi:hypothetical protein